MDGMDDVMMGNIDDDEAIAFTQPPPGKEGLDHSHIGDEDSDILEEIHGKMAGYHLWYVVEMHDYHCAEELDARNCHDTPTHTDQTKIEQGRWDLQWTNLVDSYLMWRHEPWALSSPVKPTPSHSPSSEPMPETEHSGLPGSDLPPGQADIPMETVDTYSMLHLSWQYTLS
jgi:hypothetical protein